MSHKVACIFLFLLLSSAQKLAGQDQDLSEDTRLMRLIGSAQYDHSVAEEIGLTQDQKKSIQESFAKLGEFQVKWRKVLSPRSDGDVLPEEKKAKLAELNALRNEVFKSYGDVLLPQQLQRARELVRQSQNESDGLINGMQSEKMIKKFKIAKPRVPRFDLIRDKMKDEVRDLKQRQRKEIVELLKKRDKLIKEQLGKKEQREYDKYFGKPVPWYAEEIARQMLSRWPEER